MNIEEQIKDAYISFDGDFIDISGMVISEKWVLLPESKLNNLLQTKQEEAVRGFWREFHKNRVSDKPINANLLLETYLKQEEEK